MAIWRTAADHVLVSAATGAAAVGFFWTAARRLWSDMRFAIAMTVLVAFGTNYWWIASTEGSGRSPHFAVFFLTAGLAEAAGRRRPWLMACARLAGTLAPAGLSHRDSLCVLAVDGDVRIRRETVKRFAVFAGVVGLAAVFYLGYNYARYERSRLGYYHAQYLNEPWFARGRFDVTYIPRHLKAIFYQLPCCCDTFPYIVRCPLASP